MPTLDFAFLCDYARQDPGTPIHALAIAIDTIGVPEVPTGRNLGVVARFLFTKNECGRPHRIEIFVQDTDGKRVAQITGTVEPQWSEDIPPGWPTGAALALNFGIPLPTFGFYSVEFLMNDSSVKSLNFRVVEVAAPENRQP